MQVVAETGYYPTAWELIVMLGIPGLVLLAGIIVQRKLAGPGMPLPFPIALFMFIGMLASFCVMLTVFSTAEPSVSRMQIENAAKDGFDYANLPPVENRWVLLGFYCVLAYLAPLGYYINLLRNSYATGIVDRIGPFSARIEDPSEFASARKLALRGDVDGAVQVYRNYRENSCDALFEAARLLKAEDRFAEAAAVFQEISEKFYERRPAWADATYQIAKISEQNLHDITNAAELYRTILKRTPESRFAALAGQDLARLQVVDEEYAEELVDTPKPSVEKDPFYAGRRAAPVKAAAATPAQTPENGSSAEHPNESGAPIDPFFALRDIRRVTPSAAKQAATGKKSAAKKPAAKKPAAKSSAKSAAKPAVKPAVKPKPAAKAKPAAKKKSSN